MDNSLVPIKRLYRVVVSREKTHQRQGAYDDKMVTYAQPIKRYLIYDEPSKSSAIERIKERLYPIEELQKGRVFTATQLINVAGIDDIFEE